MRSVFFYAIVRILWPKFKKPHVQHIQIFTKTRTFVEISFIIFVINHHRDRSTWYNKNMKKKTYVRMEVDKVDKRKPKYKNMIDLGTQMAKAQASGNIQKIREIAEEQKRINDKAQAEQQS